MAKPRSADRDLVGGLEKMGKFQVSKLKLASFCSAICSVAMYLIVGMRLIPISIADGIIMICLHTEVHMPNSNGFYRHQIHFTNSPY
jgi:hypothetical protein